MTVSMVAMVAVGLSSMPAASLFAVLLGGCVAAGTDDRSAADPAEREPVAEAQQAIVVGNGINYNGGFVMHGTADVYLIFYGNWSASPAAPGILRTLVENLGGSPWFNINATYWDNSGPPGAQIPATTVLAFSGSTTDLYSHGNSINDDAVAQIVTRAIDNGSLPYDANGIYLVLGASDVTESGSHGICSSSCGWHWSDHLHNVLGPIDRFGFIVHPSQCPGLCELPDCSSGTPNGDPIVDSLANLIAAELADTVTDPDHNAWWWGNNQESADKCSRNFTNVTYTTANGTQANIHLGSRDFRIQQNWPNTPGAGCSMGNGCPHDRCTSGGPLSTTCNASVASVCAADPYCCNTAWDGYCVSEVETVAHSAVCAGICSHAECSIGDALSSSCSQCTQQLCAADSYCCNNNWDSICVGEVASICHDTCN